LLYAWNAAKELVGDDLEEHDGGAAAGDDMIAFTL
jgi:hypothetical protein